MLGKSVVPCRDRRARQTARKSVSRDGLTRHDAGYVVDQDQAGLVRLTVELGSAELKLYLGQALVLPAFRTGIAREGALDAPNVGLRRIVFVDPDPEGNANHVDEPFRHGSDDLF